MAALLELAMRVEGVVRSIGMHAGGVLSRRARSPTFARCTCSRAVIPAVSQYDKDDVEAIGLVKFDFLGLATLTILELAKDYIVARRAGSEGLRLRQDPAG